MDEGGGEVAVTGEEEGGEVSRIPLFYDLPSDNTPTLLSQEWAITSPLHLAAFNGNLPQLQEALKES